MIHDYFILLSFLSLGILIVSLSSYLKSGKYLLKVTKEDHNSLRFRRKARIWRNIMLIFVIVLLSSRLSLFLVGPSELISRGFSSQQYINYFLLCAVFSILWIITLYFRYLQRYIKPEIIEKYQQQIAAYQLILVMIDLIVTGWYFLRGYTSLFEPSASTISEYAFMNANDFIFLISMILLLLLALIVFYVLFIYMRSLKFLTHYLVIFIILFATSIFCAFSGSFQFLGWFESIDLNLKILSWHYGYLGWIYLLFLGGGIFTLSAAFIVLNIKNQFLDASRIRLVILPLVKTGFTCIIAFSLLTITPVFMNLI